MFISPSKQTESKSSDTSVAKTRAKTYLGRRFELKKAVEAGKEKESVLKAHTELLIEKRKMMDGIVFEGRLKDKTLYLIGTSHLGVGVKGEEPTNPEAITAFVKERTHPKVIEMIRSCQVFVEVDISNKEELKKSQELIAQKVHEYLIDKYCEMVGEEESDLDDCDEDEAELKRIENETALSQNIIRLGTDYSAFLIAQSAGKKVGFLEPFKDQAHYMIALKKHNLENHRLFFHSVEFILETIDALKFGNLPILKKLVAQLPAALHKLSVARNAIMAEKLFTHFQKETTPILCIVGAQHVVEEGGLISLLEKKGFKFKQLRL